MTIATIAKELDDVVASPAPLETKLSRVDRLICDTVALSNQRRRIVRRPVFDRLLDTYLALSAQALASA
ncbi:MAG TPA: hypothetical protein VFB22_17930 [Candidatus Baltobacteraceae bacterium]|nr:hypothetical protein [Candidatus Baltobacteraceae bacterium]